MQKYRKICHWGKCGRKFTGGKLARYCSASHRQLDYLERAKAGTDLHQLKEILRLELGYIAPGDLMQVVKVCIAAVKYWKQNKG